MAVRAVSGGRADTPTPPLSPSAQPAAAGTGPAALARRPCCGKLGGHPGHPLPVSAWHTCPQGARPGYAQPGCRGRRGDVCSHSPCCSAAAKSASCPARPPARPARKRKGDSGADAGAPGGAAPAAGGAAVPRGARVRGRTSVTSRHSHDGPAPRPVSNAERAGAGAGGGGRRGRERAPPPPAAQRRAPAAAATSRGRRSAAGALPPQEAAPRPGPSRSSGGLMHSAARRRGRRDGSGGGGR